jgi:hypothetical protein
MLFHFFIWMAENPPRADKSAPTDVQIHLSKCIIWLLRLAIASLGRMILQKMYANLRAFVGIIKESGAAITISSRRLRGLRLYEETY